MYQDINFFFGNVSIILNSPENLLLFEKVIFSLKDIIYIKNPLDKLKFIMNIVDKITKL